MSGEQRATVFLRQRPEYRPHNLFEVLGVEVDGRDDDVVAVLLLGSIPPLGDDFVGGSLHGGG